LQIEPVERDGFSKALADVREFGEASVIKHGKPPDSNERIVEFGGGAHQCRTS
jgi:hypothetical protein